jgi:para-nitrobenzyl esterase
VSDVPVLVGHTRDEFRTFAAARVAAHGPVTDDDASAAVARFGPAGGRAGYEELLAAEGLPIDAATVFETVNADWLFRMPSARLAAVRAAAGAPTHLFEFAHSVPKLDAAPHGGENPLIFGNFAGGTAERFYVAPASAGTEALGTYLRGIWAAFAHTGDPGWAPYTEHDGGAMVFDTASSRRPYPHARTLAAYSATPPAALDVVGD